jgi:hypothetical protein
MGILGKPIPNLPQATVHPAGTQFLRIKKLSSLASGTE